MAATSEISSIPLPLREGGRFETDILLPVPDSTARKTILKSMNHQLNPELREATLDKLGDRTHAYTAKDLKSLVNRAISVAQVNLWRLRENGKGKFRRIGVARNC